MFNIQQVENPFIICPELTASLHSWEWYVGKCHHWWWVAFEGKRWAAYSGLAFYDKETAVSGPVFVQEWARGNGLQRSLHRRKEAFARKLGLKSILACTDVANIYSSNNLIASGFKLRRPWLGTKGDALYWEKKLG